MSGQRIVFGRVTGTTTYGNLTANGNPTPTVTLASPDGRTAEYRYSNDAADAYGADNPDRREMIHAYALTASDRIAGVSDASTRAFRTLAELFPRGSRVGAMVTRVSSSGMSRDVVILGINDCGEIERVSHLVAQVLGWEWNHNRRALVVRGTGMDMLFHTVYTLSSVLYGDAGALTYYQI